MAGEAYYRCPHCDARSKTPGFGTEPFRSRGPCTIPFSDDPVITRRRNRARTLRAANGGGK